MTLYKSYTILKQLSNMNPLMVDKRYVRRLYKDTGTKIYEWRKVRCLSTREAAIQLGISKTIFNDAERGIKNPLRVIRKILAYAW